MKIKITPLLFWMLPFLFCFTKMQAQKNNQLVSIKGIVKNFNNQIELQDMSEMSALDLPHAERFFTPDSNNHFHFSFALEKSSYFRLGRNILYLSPGDHLSLFIDREKPDSAHFEGVGSEVNEYLKSTPYPKGGSFLNAGRNIKSNIQETVEVVFELAEKRSIQLANVTNVSAHFKKLEAARIDADALNSLIALNEYFQIMKRIKKDYLESFKKEYNQIVQPYIKTIATKISFESNYLQLQVYREIVPTLLSNLPTNTKNRKQIEDWLQASNLANSFRLINDRNNKNAVEKQIRQISSARYKHALTEMLQKRMAFRNGDDAIDFKMLDTNHLPMPLSRFKGKIIYIDLWATWCGPCLQEMPAFEALKAKYKNNTEIVFLSISIDDDREKWMRSLKARNTKDHQYIINRLKLQAYNVASIPRSILINKDFKVEELNADLPSSKKITQVLDDLVKK